MHILKIALLSALILTTSANAATIVRQIDNPFLDNKLGFGLANDGNNLYVSGATDGNIYRINSTTLSITSTIITPATRLLGLEYHNGTLYAADPRPENNDLNPSNVYSINSSSGAVLNSFNAPSNSVVGLSMGPDNLLYAMDGYTARASDIPVVYAFNLNTGAVENTLTFSNSLFGTDIIEWVNDTTIIVDDRLGLSGLSFYSSDGAVFNRTGSLVIDGLVGNYDWRGSSLMGDSLYLWAQQPGTSNHSLIEVTGISIVPIPQAFWLLCSGLIGLIGLAKRNT